MGGGADHGHGEASHGDFRAKVWSMTGGPNCRPKHWRRNTAIAMAGVFLICIPIAMKSAELEVLFSPISLFTRLLFCVKSLWKCGEVKKIGVFFFRMRNLSQLFTLSRIIFPVFFLVNMWVSVWLPRNLGHLGKLGFMDLRLYAIEILEPYRKSLARVTAELLVVVTNANELSLKIQLCFWRLWI